MNKFLRKKDGSIIMLAILIITAILTTTLTLSILVISSIKRVGLQTDSIYAYYVAEGGVEEALYQIRKLNADPDSLTANCGAGCSRSIKYEFDGEVHQPLLNEDESMQVNLINFNEEIGQGIAKVKIFGRDATFNLPGLTAIPQMEATLTAILYFNPATPGSPLFQGSIDKAFDDNICERFLAICQENPCLYDETDNPDDTDCKAAGFKLQSYTGCYSTFDTNKNTSHLLKIKALDDGIKDLRIVACNDRNERVNIGNKIIIDGKGISGSVAQKLSVQFQPYAAAFGYFDYVVFSDYSIIKKQPADCNYVDDDGGCWILAANRLQDCREACDTAWMDCEDVKNWNDDASCSILNSTTGCNNCNTNVNGSYNPRVVFTNVNYNLQATCIQRNSSVTQDCSKDANCGSKEVCQRLCKCKPR